MAQRERTVEAKERIIKLVEKMFVVSGQLCLKSGASTNKMGNIQVDQGKHQSVKIENLKQDVLKTENAQQNKRETSGQKLESTSLTEL